MHFQIVGPSRFDEVLQSDFKSLFTFLRNDFNPNVSSAQETCLGSLIETCKKCSVITASNVSLIE